MSHPNTSPSQNQNARRHGLNSNYIPPELLPAFNALRNELLSECRPDGSLEYILFDRLVTARWQMLRALDCQNELYDHSDGQDPLCHPATRVEADLYSRYYVRFEGSFNRAYKQLKDSQTNRIIQHIETQPDVPYPTLKLADALKIQRFAKRIAGARAKAAKTAKQTQAPVNQTPAPAQSHSAAGPQRSTR
ncbi:MAG: hypothetical protein IT168_15610 [Bryobacterales bacterium]|nr:hypothetical protein [Bryobacterales bacterium]